VYLVDHCLTEYNIVCRIFRLRAVQECPAQTAPAPAQARASGLAAGKVWQQRGWARRTPRVPRGSMWG